MSKILSLVKSKMIKGSNRTLNNGHHGQSLIEFALILPLMVLVIVGIFELGRAFFSYIAISNAAREGVRMYTFMPDTTTYDQMIQTVSTEIGSSTVVDSSRISSIVIDCGSTYSIVVVSTAGLASCPNEQPVRVTVTYLHDLILGAFFSQPITIRRSVEMMKP